MGVAIALVCCLVVVAVNSVLSAGRRHRQAQLLSETNRLSRKETLGPDAWRLHSGGWLERGPRSGKRIEAADVEDQRNEEANPRAEIRVASTKAAASSSVGVAEEEDTRAMREADQLMLSLREEARAQEQREREAAEAEEQRRLTLEKRRKAEEEKRKQAEKQREKAEEEQRALDEKLNAGEVVYYKHRDAGWILVKILKIDHEGSFERGGATYVIGGAPQLKGAEVETTRHRLFRTIPD